ncbi:hypothetical protein IFM89_037474 [Coptis chinensis]|uniref:Uncharacterized protein n=1 Tax=Coptis chinensis TaxID=261450 RepID=A0A835HRT4_9MAGN|nr:hypothetical protein IFM89_037474 [Coptis chinensis]
MLWGDIEEDELDDYGEVEGEEVDKHFLMIRQILKGGFRHCQGRKETRTFSAPKKWMKGKGCVTIQFGCCYNYAVLKDGREPGILRDEHVDPIPPFFKVVIRRSVLVLKRNGADVAKHCVPAVPTRRFVPEPDLHGLQPLPYDVDESNVMNPPKSPPLMNRHPVRQVDYDNRREFSSRGNRSESRYFGQRLQPLPYDVDESNVMYPPKSPPLANRQPVRQVVSENGRGFSGRGNHSEPRYVGQTRRRMRVSLGGLQRR